LLTVVAACIECVVIAVLSEITIKLCLFVVDSTPGEESVGITPSSVSVEGNYYNRLLFICVSCNSAHLIRNEKTIETGSEPADVDILIDRRLVGIAKTGTGTIPVGLKMMTRRTMIKRVMTMTDMIRMMMICVSVKNEDATTICFGRGSLTSSPSH